MFYYIFRQTELDGIIVFAFLSHVLFLLFKPKNNHLKVWHYVLLSTFTYAGIFFSFKALHIFSNNLILENQSTPYWFYFLSTIVIESIWAFFCLKNSLTYKLIYISFYMSFIQLYKLVCSPLYVNEIYMQPDVYRFWDLLTTFLLFVLLFFFSVLFRKIKLTSTLQIAPKKYYLATFFPISMLFISILITNNRKLLVYTGPILAGCIAINLPIIYYFFSQIISAYENRKRLDEALTQEKAQLARYRFSVELQEQIKKERHELKNNYFFIQTLLKEKKYERLDSYLEEVTGEKLADISEIQTGNMLMDYLLNKKVREAKKFHIKTYTEVLVPNQMPVSEDTLCTILLNLLDNAIDASRNEENPDIHISIKCIQNYLICKISNKVSQNVMETNPQFLTTKPDKSNHGLGIKIIKNSVKKCNGILDFSIEKGYFKASVMLPLTH